jgi:AcrR family transcriptional regulator
MSDQQADQGVRGPAEHSIRDQIVLAATEHFRRYGYEKTTVGDLAAAIGFSKAYIYKFFSSKKAIGEAICSDCLNVMMDRVELTVSEAKSPTDKLRRLLQTVVADSVQLFFDDRKLHDIAASSYIERWNSKVAYTDRLDRLIAQVLVEGRSAGEFERKTPLDDTVRGIRGAMEGFLAPVMLQYNLDGLEETSGATIALILRSLSP